MRGLGASFRTKMVSSYRTFSKHWTGLSLISTTIKIMKEYNKSVILLPTYHTSFIVIN